MKKSINTRENREKRTMKNEYKRDSQKMKAKLMVIWKLSASKWNAQVYYGSIWKSTYPISLSLSTKKKLTVNLAGVRSVFSARNFAYLSPSTLSELTAFFSLFIRLILLLSVFKLPSHIYLHFVRMVINISIAVLNNFPKQKLPAAIFSLTRWFERLPVN